MAKVGMFVKDPRAGSYCQITLDSGEKIIVNHDKSRLTIEQPKLFGLTSDRLFVCDLEAAEARRALSELTRDAAPQSADATPLGAFVRYVKDCATAAEVKTRCTALLAGRVAPG
jgi:hypothetical protein